MPNGQYDPRTASATQDMVEGVREAVQYYQVIGQNPDEVTLSQANRELPQAAVPAYLSDRIFYRMAMYILGSSIVLILLITLTLALLAIEIPQFLGTTLATIIGIFAGLLVPRGGKY
jgi:hypothetical protein